MRAHVLGVFVFVGGKGVLILFV